MPLYQEPTFHDRQRTSHMVIEQTSSTEFVNVPGGTLTTKQLSQPGNYTGSTSLIISASLNNTIAEFRLLVNGDPVGEVTPVSLRVKDIDLGYTLNGLIDPVNPMSVFQLQWRTNQGTLTLVEYGILIDGVPSSRVVI